MQFFGVSKLVSWENLQILNADSQSVICACSAPILSAKRYAKHTKTYQNLFLKFTKTLEANALRVFLFVNPACKYTLGLKSRTRLAAGVLADGKGVLRQSPIPLRWTAGP